VLSLEEFVGLLLGAEVLDTLNFGTVVPTAIEQHDLSCRRQVRAQSRSAATSRARSAAIAHNTVLNPAEVVSEKMMKTLVDETTRMVVGFLK
jgi:hypothetical protein